MACKFVAEVSGNFLTGGTGTFKTPLSRTLEFIKVAKDIGCWGVKYQLFKVDKLFSDEAWIVNHDKEERKARELPLEFIPEIRKECRKYGIMFGCTPFYNEAVEELLPYVDFFKIASYDLLRLDLIRLCAKTKKPLVIATGTANLAEVESAVLEAKKEGVKDLTVLHCVSLYPTPPNLCNLSCIKTMREQFGVDVGWSDHTVDPEVIKRAVLKWNSSMIEFHLDLDKKGNEYKFKHCWLPKDIQETIGDVKDTSRIFEEFSWHESDGNGEKKPAVEEKNERVWRADPSDGLRPLINEREAIRAGFNSTAIGSGKEGGKTLENK